MSTPPIPNPYAPPQAFVRDIVVETAGIAPADRGTRLAAAILDGIILAVMVYAPMMLMMFMAPFAIDGDGEVSQRGAMAMVLVGGGLALVGCIAWAWLTIRYVLQNGQSIAKKMLGIKVVRRDGSPAGLGRIFWLRNVVNGLLGILPLYGLVDCLFIFAESRQCLHDKIADTIVVKA
jgi:uncharacterized RDD family membrane protein YckC